MGERPDELEWVDPLAADREAVSEYEGWQAGRPDGDPDTGPHSGDRTWGVGSDATSTDAIGGYPDEPPGTGSGITPEEDIAATRAHIEQTRSGMSETIDAIQEKLSPSTLAHQAKETVKDATIGKATTMFSNAGDAVSTTVANTGETAKGFGSTMIETIRHNPVPAALAGLGLGWLLMSGRRQGSDAASYRSHSYAPPGYNRQYDYGYTPRYESEQPSSSTIGQAATDAQNMVGQAADSAGQLANQTQDAAGQAVSQVQDTAAQLGMQAQYQAQRAASGLQGMIEERPLAVAAGAVALGLAIGLSIPMTPQENRLMGETRDSLVDQAQQTVQETAQKVQSVAQETVGAAKEEAQQQFSER